MFVFDNLETIKVHLYVCSHTTCLRCLEATAQEVTGYSVKHCTISEHVDFDGKEQTQFTCFQFMI